MLNRVGCQSYQYSGVCREIDFPTHRRFCSVDRSRNDHLVNVGSNPDCTGLDTCVDRENTIHDLCWWGCDHNRDCFDRSYLQELT